MKFGVDFGTTRTTIAVVDRGNYPLVSFIDTAGDDRDFIPSIVALDEDAHCVFGFEAEEAASQGRPFIRSFKRALADANITPTSTLRLGNRDIEVIELLTRFLAYVADQVRTNSSVSEVSPDEPLEAVIGIPARAWSAQRFLTLEAFKNAGWSVIEMLNEPSAAGFEYTHRHGGTLNSRRTSVLVYDLGGGTFDASLVAATGTSHVVLDSRGDNLLGGDDFDMVLATILAKAANITPAQLGDAGWARLIDDARIAKETLTPQSRYISAPVGGVATSAPVTDFYDDAQALVDHTLVILDPLLDTDEDGNKVLPDHVAGLYVVGGASQLPLVSRILRARFGRRVHRSPHTGGSTAIGLALAADETAGYSLTERLSRGVGVFREKESGRTLSFDPLLDPDARWTPGQSTVVTRRYRAAHNVGYYRFVEYLSTDAEGVPRGEVSPCGEILMPFDRLLQIHDENLAQVEIVRTESGPLVEERYFVDENGIVDVEIADLDSGYSTRIRLGRR